MGGGNGRGGDDFDRHMARVEDIEPSAFASMPMVSGVPRAATYPEVLRHSLLPGGVVTSTQAPVLERAGLAHDRAQGAPLDMGDGLLVETARMRGAGLTHGRHSAQPGAIEAFSQKRR